MGPDWNRAVAARMGYDPIISGLTGQHLDHLDLRTMWCPQKDSNLQTIGV